MGIVYMRRLCFCGHYFNTSTQDEKDWNKNKTVKESRSQGLRRGGGGIMIKYSYTQYVYIN